MKEAAAFKRNEKALLERLTALKKMRDLCQKLASDPDNIPHNWYQQFDENVVRKKATLENVKFLCKQIRQQIDNVDLKLDALQESPAKFIPHKDLSASRQKAANDPEVNLQKLAFLHHKESNLRHEEAIFEASLMSRSLKMRRMKNKLRQTQVQLAEFKKQEKSERVLAKIKALTQRADHWTKKIKFIQKEIFRVEAMVKETRKMLMTVQSTRARISGRYAANDDKLGTVFQRFA